MRGLRRTRVFLGSAQSYNHCLQIFGLEESEDRQSTNDASKIAHDLMPQVGAMIQLKELTLRVRWLLNCYSSPSLKLSLEVETKWSSWRIITPGGPQSLRIIGSQWKCGDGADGHALTGTQGDRAPSL